MLIQRASFTMIMRAVTDDHQHVTGWQSTSSDTDLDAFYEKTSDMLYRDWLRRIKTKSIVPYLPKGPAMPYLSLAHYPDFDESATGGVATELKIIERPDQSTQFFVKGKFHSNQLGQEIRSAIEQEEFIRRSGETPLQPIRVSVAWFDLAHAHGKYLFIRRSMEHRCPLCLSGIGDKTYLQGQLEHLAVTRVPVNDRTAIGVIH